MTNNYLLMPSSDDTAYLESIECWRKSFEAKYLDLESSIDFETMSEPSRLVVPLAKKTLLKLSVAISKVRPINIILLVDYFTDRKQILNIAKIATQSNFLEYTCVISTQAIHTDAIKRYLHKVPIITRAPFVTTLPKLKLNKNKEKIYILLARRYNGINILPIRCLLFLKLVTFSKNYDIHFSSPYDLASSEMLPDYFVRIDPYDGCGQLAYSLARQGSIPVGPVECNITRTCSPYGVCENILDSFSRIKWISNNQSIKDFASGWARVKAVNFVPSVIAFLVMSRVNDADRDPMRYDQYLHNKTSIWSKISLLKHSQNKESSVASIRLICMLKNGILFLSQFLCHYRSLGVNEFYFIDNISDDGTIEELCKHDDVTVYSTRLPHWKYQNEIRTAVIYKHCFNSWFFCVDVDELFVYPQMEEYTLKRFIEFVSSEGASAVSACMVDLLPENGCLDDADSVDKLNYFDALSIESKKYFSDFKRDCCFNTLVDPKLAIKLGGPRQKLVNHSNSKVLLSKHPLMFLDAEIEPLAGGHFCNYATVASVGCALLHYKFLNGFIEKTKEISRRNLFTYAEKDLIDGYNKLIDGSVDIGQFKSRFTGSESLKEAGVFHNADKFRAWVECS